MKTVKFLVGCGIYNAGEFASFQDDHADKLVKNKFAEVAESEKPVEAKSEAKPKKAKTAQEQETF
jgi:hypothetical protein